ncbi:GerAB/ArcD/ProY family transporter [Alkaliphilus transvaalensis]|uniref:GerAB/ArcD/ProY family transporter n=1 Tax=Alkaliphilus transvaalensis TaxID=114628 RepID=UPI00047D1208|nr:endospore germination permease [Alkaliphilus transvaalensis]
MEGIREEKKELISFNQLIWITVAQLGGASIIYLPGMIEAGRDIWISNLIASIVGYVVIYCHYLPLSLCPECSMTETLNKYWGRVIGGFINLYYNFFFFFLCCLIVSDVYYFGKITFPETPGYIFTIFFIVPIVYGIKLGLEVVVRLLESLTPLLAILYFILFILVVPKLNFQNLQPVMADGIRPVLAGSIPNMNFPYAQILPVAFYYKHTRAKEGNEKKFLKYTFIGIVMATLLLTIRSLASVAAFEEETLKTLVFPPFSTIRVIEVGDIIERLDPFFLAVFYATTFFKFVLTFYIICESISDYFRVGEPKDFAWPLAILIGVTMPFLIPRFDIILRTVVPYFFVSIPLFVPIPLILYMTIKIKDGRKKAQ